MSLNEKQQQAFDEFSAFDGVVFGIFGGPGTGKSHLTAEILKSFRVKDDSKCFEDMFREDIVAAPTHKAINVMRRFMDGHQLLYEVGYNAAYHDRSRFITGTTAQLLGISPVIIENQNSEEIKFGRRGRGILDKVQSKVLVIDEVSMLSKPHFMDLYRTCKADGTKLLVIGDPGQLPPVKAQPIPLNKLKNQVVLEQPMRQENGSRILDLAYAIRNNEDWRAVQGKGVVKTSHLVDEFLEIVETPEGLIENDRSVYIAYRNAAVNAAQDKACRKVYGHSRMEFAPGELVVAENNFYEGRNLLAANQDELIVEHIADYVEGDPGRECTLRRVIGGGTFSAYYLSPEDIKNPRHVFNAKLSDLLKRAKKLQEQYNEGDRSVDIDRRAAWVNYFEWKDQTVISFRHPFAMTAHKSQGSTVMNVFANVNDLSRINKAAFYVAVTRPREVVYLG